MYRSINYTPKQAKAICGLLTIYVLSKMFLLDMQVALPLINALMKTSMLLSLKINLECYRVLLHKDARLERYGNVAGKFTIFFGIPRGRRKKRNPLDGRAANRFCKSKYKMKQAFGMKVLLLLLNSFEFSPLKYKRIIISKCCLSAMQRQCYCMQQPTQFTAQSTVVLCYFHYFKYICSRYCVTLLINY